MHVPPRTQTCWNQKHALIMTLHASVQMKLIILKRSWRSGKRKRKNEKTSVCSVNSFTPKSVFHAEQKPETLDRSFAASEPNPDLITLVISSDLQSYPPDEKTKNSSQTNVFLVVPLEKQYWTPTQNSKLRLREPSAKLVCNLTEKGSAQKPYVPITLKCLGWRSVVGHWYLHRSYVNNCSEVSGSRPRGPESCYFFLETLH